MNKAKKGRKLSRVRNKRQALLKGLAQSLVLRERITTTEAKAKEVRSYVEKFITKSRTDNVLTRRYLSRYFPDKKAVRKLVLEIGPRYKERKGGYTRIVKRNPRKIDSARMALIELV